MVDTTMENNEMSDEPTDENGLSLDESSAIDKDNISDRTEEDVPDTVGSSQGDVMDKSDLPEEGYADLSQSYVSDKRPDQSKGSDQRRHARFGFTYPVEIFIFSSELTNISFDGFIEDISVSGAGILFEDRDGRVKMEGLGGSSIKIVIRMPQGNDVELISFIRWIKKDIYENMIVKVGIEFESLEEWQLKTIRRLISLKNKDQNMMWNLFENYEKNIS